MKLNIQAEYQELLSMTFIKNISLRSAHNWFVVKKIVCDQCIMFYEKKFVISPVSTLLLLIMYQDEVYNGFRLVLKCKMRFEDRWPNFLSIPLHDVGIISSLGLRNYRTNAILRTFEFNVRFSDFIEIFAVHERLNWSLSKLYYRWTVRYCWIMRLLEIIFVLLNVQNGVEVET